MGEGSDWSHLTWMGIFDHTIFWNNGFHLPELGHDVAEGVLALDLSAVGVLGEDRGDVGIPRAEFFHFFLFRNLNQIGGSNFLLNCWQLRDQQVRFDVHHLDPIAEINRETDEIIKDLVRSLDEFEGRRGRKCEGGKERRDTSTEYIARYLNW
jgi:hypothetical protein